MLTREQVIRVADIFCDYFQNGTPTGVELIQHRQGAFPNNMDEVLLQELGLQHFTDCQDQELDFVFGPAEDDTLAVEDLQAGLNHGYDGSILFSYEQAAREMVATISFAEYGTTAGLSLSVARSTGAVTFEDETRNLPEGFEPRNIVSPRPSVDHDAQEITIRIPVSEV